jgi:hypothetical protein
MCALSVLIIFVRIGAAGGLHEQGNLTLSFGGSVAHTFTYDRISETTTEIVDNELFFFDEAEESPQDEADDFYDLDLTLFLSLGYFVIDRLEVGLSGSTMTTSYHDTDQSDFTVYDAQAYAKYFFDNESSFTPYVKLQGGSSWIESGDYEETDGTAGGSVGLEFFGMGPVTWFLELSSEYTRLGGDLSGSEWRNQVYVGITWYMRRNRRPKAPAVEALNTRITDWDARIDSLEASIVGQETMPESADQAPLAILQFAEERVSATADMLSLFMCHWPPLPYQLPLLEAALPLAAGR